MNEASVKKFLPEILAFLMLIAGVPYAVNIAPDKITAMLLIPAVCVVYLLMKWEVKRDEIKPE
jgi:hypothetical protein